MTQSLTMSAIESAASTAIGFVVSWALTPPILALFGYQAGTGVAFGIVCVYTALSFARGWFVRRLFNWIHHGRDGNGYQPLPGTRPGRPPGAE